MSAPASCARSPPPASSPGWRCWSVFGQRPRSSTGSLSPASSRRSPSRWPGCRPLSDWSPRAWPAQTARPCRSSSCCHFCPARSCRPTRCPPVCAGSVGTSLSPPWWSPCARCSQGRRSATPPTWPWPGPRSDAVPGDMMSVVEGNLVGRSPKHMITIGRLVAYAGVTIKAVRHYHRRGLLEEPPRDSSGYRRYTAEHAIDLVKIKTLAEAGVPLARIKELLAADPERFAAAITEIDHNLQERAKELRRTRERIARLGAGDRLFASAEVAGYLDRLQELGVSQRTVQMERDGWILMQSASPKEAAIWIADKGDALSDAEFRAIYLEYDAAFDWSPG